MSKEVSSVTTARGPSVRRGWSVRARMLVVMISLMTAGLVVAGGLTYSLLFQQLEERVEAELLQERDELRRMAEQGPQGEAEGEYQNIEALLLAFLQSSVPGRYESHLGIIDGSAAVISGGTRPFDLDDPAVLELVAEEMVPGRSVLRNLTVDGTDVRLLIASVQLENEVREGVFVVGIDTGSQREALLASMRTYALVSLATLALASAAGFVVATRLLRPLADLREATSTIDTNDMTVRVLVEGADHDVAQLALTFNQMLDRLETGFSEQRRFLDDAAHELRTPLTILRGNLEVTDSADPADVDQTKELLFQEIDRMNGLVDDLLLLAKAQRPDFVRPEKTDAGDFLDETLQRVRLLGDRSWCIGDRATGEVSLDRQRLAQAVLQLGANAVTFTEPTDTITLSTRWAMPDSTVAEIDANLHSECFVVSVQDTGVGIAPEQLSHIFERFGRGDNTRREEGSGLGLAIVEAIARGHGGVATVQSVEDLGSTFRIWLPVTRVGVGGPRETADV
ncbi:MAG: HAMP domain-containing sensor histidine kinase [Ornithinimicrobium sp.]